MVRREDGMFDFYCDNLFINTMEYIFDDNIRVYNNYEEAVKNEENK